MPRRLALLVATYRYQDAGLRQLTAPGYDAEELAAVLRHPDIAGFEVTTLINEPNHVVGRAIGEFYRNRRRNDLTFLYFTGHGLKDDQGRLYLAMTDTRLDSLLFTALSAQQIDDAMESCLSRQKVLALDCCYSGAFPAGRISKADPEVHTLERFRGKGRVVLTASDATQYSFEGNEISGRGIRSVFTRFLVEGLITGKGDLDNDGDISLDELYSYVYERVVEEMPQQRPKKQESVEGRIVIARNIYWTLPVHLLHAVESSIASDRLTALDGLAQLCRIGNEFVRAVVIDHIRYLIDDDSEAVSAAAIKFMMTFQPDGVRAEAEGRPVTEKRIAPPTSKPRKDDATQAEQQRRSRSSPSMNKSDRLSARDAVRTGLAVLFMLVAGALFAASVFAPESQLSGWALIRTALLVMASVLLVTGVYFTLAFGVVLGVILWNLQLIGFLTLLGDEASFVVTFTGTSLLIWGLILVCFQSPSMTAGVSLREDRWSTLAVIIFVITITINGAFGKFSYWGGQPEWVVHVGALAAICLIISLVRMNPLQCGVALTAAVFFVVHSIFWRVLSLGGVGVTNIYVWIDVTTTVLALGGSCLGQRENLGRFFSHAATTRGLNG